MIYLLHFFFYIENKSFVPNNSAVVFLYNDSLTALKSGLDGQPPINSKYILNNRSIIPELHQHLERDQIMVSILLFHIFQNKLIYNLILQETLTYKSFMGPILIVFCNTKAHLSIFNLQT